ncbi:hypothetical protein HF086_013262 [Spodoptera exigua]|uniref:Uncharacterized protein n=1 Tax=Spodoptera exigua TaxID=7107 RepID=A0A922MEZ7_SPOEX|nr:hypothetical protein HF086_013262 [Spodoptera exigua]
MGTYGFPLTEHDLKIVVKMYLEKSGRIVRKFKNNTPGNDWIRAALSKDILQEYIENLSPQIRDIPPTHIFNYDETNLTDDPGQKRVIVRRGCKYPEKICNASKSSTSIMFCGSASGELMPPYVVYKLQKLWDTWTENGPKGCHYSNSPSAARCRVLRPLKAGWPKIITEWKESSEGTRNPTIPKQTFPSLLKKLLENIEPNVRSNLKNGFRKCGIYPCNLDELLARIPGAIDVDNTIVSASFIDHLESKRKTITESGPKRRKKKFEIAADDPDGCFLEPNSPEESDHPPRPETRFKDVKREKESFVVVKYDERLYPGLIIDFDEKGATVDAMAKSLKSWKWPQKRH